MLSGRSFAAHLTGVCIALEHGGDASVLRAVQQWLSRTVEVTRPPVPARRGEITINEVITALPEERHAVVLGWAASAWAAWSKHQPLARGWIAAARGTRAG